MGNIYEIINSVLLAILAISYFNQNNRLKIMRTFIDSFDVQKVRDYQDMREETVIEKAKLLLENNDKVQAMIKEANKQNIPGIEQQILNTITKEHDELRDFAIKVLINQNKDSRNKLIQNDLPLTSRYILTLFQEIDEIKI